MYKNESILVYYALDNVNVQQQKRIKFILLITLNIIMRTMVKSVLDGYIYFGSNM